MARSRTPLFAIAAPLIFGFGLTQPGCLSGDSFDGFPPMCEIDADCDAGENCDEGICYGDPPLHLQFSALLEPPSNEADLLAPTEIRSLTIAQDGTITGLAFADTITVEGRVELSCDPNLELPCAQAPVPTEATIVVERPSSIPGAPPFKITANADPAGLAGGEATFSFALPRSSCVGEPCDDTYNVTVLPRVARSPRELLGEPTPAELAPPLQFELIANRDFDEVWEVGRVEDVKRVTGCLTVEGGAGVPNMQVSARARRTPLAAPARVSTRVFTGNDGCFEIRAARGFELFDIVFAPPEDAPTHPTVLLREQLISDPVGDVVTDLGDIVMPTPLTPVSVTVRVIGQLGNGRTVAVPGARVEFVTTFPAPGDNPDMDAVLVANSETAAENGNELGLADLELAPNQTYLVTVFPPEDSEFAALFSTEVAVGGSGQLPDIVLSRRLAVDGRLFNAKSTALPESQVTAAASPIMLFEATTDEDETLLTTFDYPTVTSSRDGDFFLWLDRSLAGAGAVYDILIEPPFLADAPRWSLDAVQAQSQNSLTMGDVILPDASYARGVVTGGAGQAIPGATLTIYQSRDPSFCDGECVAPVYVRGTFAADEDGIVRIVVPDPPPASAGR